MLAIPNGRDRARATIYHCVSRLGRFLVLIVLDVDFFAGRVCHHYFSSDGLV